MARSKYIYHIRHKESGRLIASFTVKAEAFGWLVRSKWKRENFRLTRVRDGMTDFIRKHETDVEWL